MSIEIGSISIRFNEEPTIEEKAKRYVLDWLKRNNVFTTSPTVDYVCCLHTYKIGENWEATLIARKPYGVMFVVTYYGNEKEAYLEVFKEDEVITIKE